MPPTATLSPAHAAPVALRDDAGTIALVGLAHMVSHFSQLLLAPLFPWLREALQASYAQLGFLMTVFFVTSTVVQAAAGFGVDRLGPRPVLLAGLSLLGLAAFGMAMSTGYWMMAGFALLAGVGNGVFHPVDYTLINRKVSPRRLGHAYSVHGITGSLGWALAPALMVPMAMAFSWRVALASAGCVVFAVLVVLWLNRQRLDVPAPPADVAQGAVGAPGRGAQEDGGRLGFLRIPAVWMCFGFFLLYAIVLSVVQAFAPEAARQLHGVPVRLVAICLSVYMVCAAVGMVAGGFLASDPARCERVVGVGFCVAASVALWLGLGSVPAGAVPVLFGVMGLASGVAGPSRDLLVKTSTPANATGRVYGVVYSGLDIGQALAPLFFGLLMDHAQFRGVLLGLAVTQLVLVASAFQVRRVRRTATPDA